MNVRKFSAIKLLQDGHLLGPFDENRKKFTKSLKSYALFGLFIFLTSIFPPKMIYINSQLDVDRITTIIIGDVVYYFDANAKHWSMIVGMTANIWAISISITYLYIHNKKENLLLYWLKIMQEIRTNDKKNEFDTKFFREQSKINYRINLALKLMVCIASVFICLPYFVLTFDLDILYLYPIAFLNYFLLFTFFFNACRVEGNLNLVPLTLQKYFIQKFEILIKQIEKTDNKDNLRLSKLIYKFNNLNHKIRIINSYFKYLFGLNFFYLTFIDMALVFLLFSANFLFRIALATTLSSLFIIDILIPYRLSTIIQIRIQKSKNSFRKFLFEPKINSKLSRKIRLLIIENEAKFTCFNLFDMSTNNAFKNALTTVCNIILLLKIYYIN